LAQTSTELSVIGHKIRRKILTFHVENATFFHIYKKANFWPKLHSIKLVCGIRSSISSLTQRLEKEAIPTDAPNRVSNLHFSPPSGTNWRQMSPSSYFQK
jgi:hypothetical protein